MPNGFHGPKPEWKRMEAPLLGIDSRLGQFAADNDFQLSRNYHNWPERSLKWNDQGLSRLIQVFLADETQMTWNLWLCAYQDRDGARYWKQEYLLKSVQFGDIEQQLDALLQQARDTVMSWQASDLVAGAKLGRV